MALVADPGLFLTGLFAGHAARALERSELYALWRHGLSLDGRHAGHDSFADRPESSRAVLLICDCSRGQHRNRITTLGLRGDGWDAQSNQHIERVLGGAQSASTQRRRVR